MATAWTPLFSSGGISASPADLATNKRFQRIRRRKVSRRNRRAPQFAERMIGLPIRRAARRIPVCSQRIHLRFRGRWSKSDGLEKGRAQAGDGLSQPWCGLVFLLFRQCLQDGAGRRLWQEKVDSNSSGDAAELVRQAVALLPWTQKRRFRLKRKRMEKAPTDPRRSSTAQVTGSRTKACPPSREEQP